MHRPRCPSAPPPAAPRTLPLLATVLVLLAARSAASPVHPDAAVVGVETAPVADPAAAPAVPGLAGPGCKRGDRFYRPETTWQEDDGCLSCTCDRGGHARCQAFMCQVTCDSPRRVQGECCPVCDGQSVVTQSSACPSLGNCTLKCTHGFVMEGGCVTCQCQQGAACTLECPAGYARDAQGNELCECACPAMGTCSKRCTHGYRRDAGGCSQCACLPAADSVTGEEVPSRNCTDAAGGGRDRDDGEYWSDGCRGCYCAAGRTLCELASCKDDPTALRRMAELALCSDNKVTGLLAGCVSCRCLLGRALCEVAACPPAACPDPLPPDRMGCCPTCPTGWPRQLTAAPDGGAPPSSSPTSTELTSPTASCPGGHGHGTSWRIADCTSCRCEAGRTECFEQRCPPLQCELQFTPRGMCCPVCLGERGVGPKQRGPTAGAPPPPPQQTPPQAGGAAATDPAVQQGQQGQAEWGACWWRNQSHAAAAEWFPDECTRCQCDPAGSGSSTCTQSVCAPPGCSGQPRQPRQPGLCCPACTDADGGVPLLVTLLAVSALLVLLVLALGLFAWQRNRRQTLDIANHRADALRAARPPATYTYNMIPTEKPLPR